MQCPMERVRTLDTEEHGAQSRKLTGAQRMTATILCGLHCGHGHSAFLSMKSRCGLPPCHQPPALREASLASR